MLQMAPNEERDLMDDKMVVLHGSSMIVDLGRAFRILDGGKEVDRGVLASLERDSGHEGHDTAPDAAWGASGVDNEVDDVHDNHVVHLLESMVGDTELMVAKVPSCLDGMMRAFADGTLNSLVFAAMGGVQDATPFVFVK